MEDLLKLNKIIEKNKVVFLLGGHDLEMMEILKTLKENGIAFSDKCLGWSNACLSAYADEIKQYERDGYRIFGVELRIDMDTPVNYIVIDHHNEYNGRKSSLEQVADIIGVELTRRQILVAVNDSRYITGMLELGATEEEINEIRLEDRKSQGATEKDESDAEISIRENMRVYRNITVVKSLTSKFSCVCDRLYKNNSLLVYTDLEWTYYGVYKNRLIEYFAEDIARGSIYYGGSDSGYIGMGIGVMQADEIEIIVKEIVKFVENA